jgi:predicted Zn-dependent peptidase
MTKTAVQFKQTRLENGLTIVAEINSEAKSVALGYFVKTGSRDESDEVAGVSHFLEHMLFKGSDKRDGLQVGLEFDQMGAQTNAYTSEEATVYYGAVLPEFTPKLLELWTDLMRPALRQEDFDTEKGVILEEIEMYLDQPSSMLFDWAKEKFFNRHPLGNSVLGTEQTITDLRLEQMRHYHIQRYAPSNLVLALAGKVDWEATLEQLRNLTADWQDYSVGRSYPSLEPRLGEHRQPYPQATQVYMVLLAPGVSAQDPRRYAASLLMNILGEEGNSRLHWALADKGLVESVSAGIDDSDRAGMFYVYAQTDPANEEDVKRVIRAELELFEAHGVTQSELDRAKNKLATALVFAGETPMQRLMSLGNSYLNRQSYEPLSETATKIAAVGLEEVNALLADKPFSRSFLYSLVPA